ncbi:MAG: hypothetical protein ACE5JU_07725 [Candidatus Binatia bacterium]
MDFSKGGQGNRPFGFLENDIDIVELKQTLLSRIDRIEAALREAETLASTETQEYEELRKRAEAKVVALEAQLQETEEALQATESAVKQIEVGLTAKNNELKDQLREKQSMIDVLQGELDDLRSKMDPLGGAPECFINLREEDVVSYNVLDKKAEREI